ncbi:hypothetical protein GCM10025868_13140 [Angustibacter aerolatus]|uniref:VIT family protein n=1 Tax=Angustibacter aerolatus TaxID=1162965 RepID=A0ABQ6JF75_9ACTN|nr:hypothetical protein GCM10025868_13140 [Angustibacter aerolatus]
MSATPDVHPHEGEQHGASVGARLNRLRAGVLGANDGIVSTAGIVVGVAGATASRGAVLTAGVAGLVAGALSMAAGEYVSVGSQRDTQQALLAKEAREPARDAGRRAWPRLAGLYEAKGLTPEPGARGRRAGDRPRRARRARRRRASASTPTTSPTRGRRPARRPRRSWWARCCRCSRSPWRRTRCGSR